MGKEYGLTIRSEKDSYTTVIIRLAAVGKGEQSDEQSNIGR